MNTMKRIAIVLASAWLLIGATACSKKKDDNSGKSVLIKISLSTAAAASKGSFSCAVNALLPSMDYATWKVNGTVRANESTLGFTTADFVNDVLTLETTANVYTANLSLGGFAASQYPYNVKVETTLNGKAESPVSIDVINNVFDRTLSY